MQTFLKGLLMDGERYRLTWASSFGYVYSIRRKQNVTLTSWK